MIELQPLNNPVESLSNLLQTARLGRLGEENPRHEETLKTKLHEVSLVLIEEAQVILLGLAPNKSFFDLLMKTRPETEILLLDKMIKKVKL
ncbi:hypothetical protein NQZ68_027987 [Dissostichus eleginoides]|nr:hypothetical protein NQZ68_027987 [Dissostichus eleginoides]